MELKPYGGGSGGGMEQKSIKCGSLCPYFKPRKGEYKPRGVCGLPSAPQYVIIDGEREEPPKWCPREEGK